MEEVNGYGFFSARIKDLLLKYGAVEATLIWSSTPDRAAPHGYVVKDNEKKVRFEVGGYNKRGNQATLIQNDSVSLYVKIRVVNAEDIDVAKQIARDIEAMTGKPGFQRHASKVTVVKEF